MGVCKDLLREYVSVCVCQGLSEPQVYGHECIQKGVG